MSKSTYPPPPFLYKLFDESNKDIYKRVSTPPNVPDNWIEFGVQNTHNIDVDLSSPKDYIKKLHDLNRELLVYYADVIKIMRQPQNYRSNDIHDHQEMNDDTDSNTFNNSNNNINTTSNTSLNNSANSKSFFETQMEQLSNLALPPAVWHSRLTPLINTKTEKLRKTFREMRAILNSLRPHQARHLIVMNLEQQLQYKRELTQQLNKYSKLGHQLVNKKLNLKDINNNTNDNDNDNDTIMDNNNESNNIVYALKSSLDQIFYT